MIAKAHEVGLMNLAHPGRATAGSGSRTFDGHARRRGAQLGLRRHRHARSARNALGAAPVILAGRDEQKAAWLPPLLEEPILCSFGLSEPDAGSDVARMKTTAVRRGDEYVLNGSKTFITNAGHAAWTVVFAKTDRGEGAPRHLRVHRPDGHAGRARSRSTSTRWASARPTPPPSRSQDVVVPAANRLGEEGEGFKIAMQTLDFTRPGTAIGAVGVAQAAYELRRRVREGARHVRRADRDAPGRQLPDRRHGDRDRGVAPARPGRPPGCSTAGRPARTLYSSFAKRFAADTAMKVTTDAVQVFGGYGYMKEYPVEKLMRDAKLFQIYEGTSQIQRLVIAKEIFMPR